MSSIIVIPARFASTRFPGKPLEMIDGKSLIQRVYEQCDKSKADDIIVATDDQRIFDHVQTFDGNVCLTSIHHANGTERIAEAIDRLIDEGEEYDIIVNVQGDEPLVDPKDIDRLLDLMEEDDTDIGTLVREMDSWEDVNNPNIVKVVTTVFEEGVADALYFSRSAIPYIRDESQRKVMSPSEYYSHVGMYAYQAEAFESIRTTESSNLEVIEQLEQLRWLQNHFVVSVIETTSKSIGVDVPADIQIVENILKSKA